LLLRPANLLLLDEPTNHLDLKSKEVLLEALQGYAGTLVFVSHDRYFVDALASRVVEVGGGQALSWFGNYEDFLRQKAALGDASHSAERVEQKSAALSGASANGEEARLSHDERKEVKRLERRRQKELAELEAAIEVLECDLAALEQQMADPELYQNATRWREVSTRHSALQETLAEHFGRWEALQEAAAAD
jgi:ATP-binding cassette subfamily F protein 3